MSRSPLHIALVVTAILVIASVGLWLLQTPTSDDTHQTYEELATRDSDKNPRNISDDRTERADRAPRQRPSKNATPNETQEDEKTPEADDKTWADPENQRVLGSKSWMAETPPEQSDEIAKKFELDRKRRALDPPIDRQSRQNSIEAVRFEVEDCVQTVLNVQPDAQVDVVLSWNATKSGHVKDVEITAKPGPDIPTFTECLLAIENTTFASVLNDTLRVEYPFRRDR